MRRVLAITLAIFAVLFVLAQLRFAPPSPGPADAPAPRFSAMRARAVQERLVGVGPTRALGTPGNARGREMLVMELEHFGLSVESQTAWACTHHGACGHVTNIVAKLAGSEPNLPIVLLTAHHDSVPASPGASDDGLGVATLVETARALKAGPQPRRSVAVVLTDGEELGLLGASAFVREHRLAQSVAATVNVDSRGSRGPSQMFETSTGNAGLAAVMAERLERPVTSSLFYEIYRRMPNDTDFSLTKAVAPGVNFANTEGIEDYHTSLDDLTTSDPGTLQHDGDNVLAMARAFAENGAPPNDGTDAVWFDVLAFGIVRWPARWSTLLAIMGLVLVAGQGLRMGAKGRGVFVFFPAVIAGVVGAAAIGWTLHAVGALPAPFVAHPQVPLAAIDLGAGAATLAIVGLLARRATPEALWVGTWVGWGVLGVVVAQIAPGASYLFVVPTLVAALARSLGPAIASAAPAAVAATLVLELACGLHGTLGFAAPPVVGLPAVLIATTIAPLLAGEPVSRPALGLGVGAILGVIVAALVPKFSVAAPQRANVVFRQDETSTRVLVDNTWGVSTWGEPPPAMIAAIGGAHEKVAALPWTMPAAASLVPRVDLAFPTADVVSVTDDGGRHRVRMRVKSRRGASTFALVFPKERKVEVKVEGRFASPRTVAEGNVVGIFGAPEDGVVVDIEADSTIAFTLIDRTSGVPAGTSAEAAAKARPRDATVFQDGDQTVVATTVRM